MPSAAETLRRAAKLAKAGRAGEAAALYREVLARYPANRRAQEGLAALSAGDTAPQALLSGVVQMAQAGRVAEARRDAEALQPLYPDDPALAGLLGALCVAAGEPAAAEPHCRRALAARPGDADAAYNLGLALQAQNSPDEAAAAYERALEANPRLAEAWNNLGALHRDRGRHAEAAAAFARAAALSPDNLDARANLGLCQRELGEAKAAKETFAALLARAPDHAPARQDFAQLHRFSEGDPELVALEAHLARAGESADRERLLFALGKAMDDLGRHAEAAEAWREANARRRAALGHDAAEDAALFARIRAVWDAPPAPLDAAPARPRPIFVLGMPRSGTTLVEQILASHPQVAACGELPLLTDAAAPLLDPEPPAAPGPDALRRVRETYLAGLAPLAGDRPVATDKMPLNFRWIGAILTALPEAAVIHVDRDPRAVAFSLFRHRFASDGNRYAYDADDIRRYLSLHDDLMAFWETRFPGRIHRLSYKGLIEDQEAVTRGLLAACGLPWHSACLDFHRTERAIATASGQQVRRALYRGSDAAWRAYAAHLPELFEGLAPADAP
jgi:tetratricopeptide (TPR) repeat protein